MKVGDMVRPVPYGLPRRHQKDPWFNRIGIIVDFEEECDYAGIAVVYMPIVYWGSDLTTEKEHLEQVEVI